MRDITLEDTIFIAFTTRAFATGIPTVLAGTPVVSAYENADLTQITAGITLGVDHDSVVGLNMLTVVATAANGYEAGKDYNLVVTTGTVGGVSVVGEVVGQFTVARSAAAVDLANGTDGLGAIKAVLPSALVGGRMDSDIGAKTGNVALSAQEKLDVNTEADTAASDYGALRPTVAGRDLDVTATGAAGIDWGNVENKATANDLAGTDIQLCDTVTTNTDVRGTDGVDTATMRGTDSAALASVCTEPRLAELDPANLPTDVANVKDDVWDEVLTGATHNVTDSAGKRLRQIDEGNQIHSGTAQAGTANTIQFDTGASATDSIYNGDRVIIVGGTGAQEHGLIVSYVGSTKTATMAKNWVITPDATSEFVIIPGSVDVATISGSAAAADNLEASAEVIVIGAAEAGTLSTTQMTTDLTEATDDHYNGRVIIWTSGVLLEQATDITDYAGATGLLTFTAVTEAPTATDTFVIV